MNLRHETARTVRHDRRSYGRASAPVAGSFGRPRGGPGPGEPVRAAGPADRFSRHNNSRQNVQLRQETGVRPEPE